MSFKRKFSIFAEMKSHNSPCIFFTCHMHQHQACPSCSWKRPGKAARNWVRPGFNSDVWKGVGAANMI